ncbi:hypothetical protein LO772_15485 [Yinghuangia sp. ASG 101]|uniref:hypothetical protein n=1 Tax=Yinghuangia sp. ASG 101 TaxID=2896848 RepID=UPI001E32C026|nr:hypothetical protein [Yinghuangia sp. ASG 101]UGQ14845.1 hypothetical protein LO772_15485 [Yinghuangia sp. ASG 101]
MSPELVTGIFGALGAVIGAGGVMATNAIASRSQTRRDHLDRAERVSDARRIDYLDVLTSLAAYVDHAREFAHAMDSGTARSDCEPLRDRYVAEWDRLIRAQAAAKLAGPDEIRSLAQELRDLIGNLATPCDDWWKSYPGRRPNNFWDRFDVARTALGAWELRFLDAAEAALPSALLPQEQTRQDRAFGRRAGPRAIAAPAADSGHV